MKSINQVVTFNAAPAEIFEALMDSKKHAGFTGAPAKISREVGGAISCHDGMVTGINVDIVKDARIVQAWRAGNFPEGVFSVATFVLQPEGRKTKLTFTQHGVPESAYEMVSTGWEEHYWTPLRALVDKKTA